MTGRLLLAFALFAVGCAAPAEAPEDLGGSSSSIIGGSIDTGHAGIVYIRTKAYGANRYFCTGTVIRPNVVLTAGHCAYMGNEFQPTLEVAFGTKLDIKSETGWTKGNVITHPKYVRGAHDGSGHDIALIMFSQDLGHAAVPLGTAEEGVATAVGFGLDEAHAFGTKKAVSLDIVDLGEHEIASADNAKATACSGDSGGPLLQNGRIVGVTSYGNAKCDGATTFSRVDDNLDFIAP